MARCTVARLMREMGLQGAVGRRFKTTKPDSSGARMDLVERDTRPNDDLLHQPASVIHPRNVLRCPLRRGVVLELLDVGPGVVSKTLIATLEWVRQHAWSRSEMSPPSMTTVAGRLARDGETQLKQSPENPGRFTRNVLRCPLRRGVVLELPTSRGGDDEALHIESFPMRAKRLEGAHSLIELAHCSFPVARRNVVHADCDVYQRLQEIAFLPTGSRPGILEDVMALEIQLSIEESDCLGEDIFVEHWQMLTPATLADSPGYGTGWPREDAIP